MKKIVFLILALNLAFSFDIDDYDRGIEALNTGDYVAAYEIFYDGCEQKDVLSCEALGDMFVNEEINEQMDSDLKKHSNIELSVSYYMKSCDLGYQNACDDVMSLRDDLNISLPAGVYENAKARYDEIRQEDEKEEALSEQNANLAKVINEIFDLVIITSSLNAEVLLKHIVKPKIIILKDKNKMQEILAQNTHAGDLILFSNDAPSFI